jgi:hypothetical protein
MEDDLKEIKIEENVKKNGRHLKHNFKKSTLIGCDIIVN